MCRRFLELQNASNDKIGEDSLLPYIDRYGCLKICLVNPPKKKEKKRQEKEKEKEKKGKKKRERYLRLQNEHLQSVSKVLQFVEYLEYTLM
jgi:hypothetical protein